MNKPTSIEEAAECVRASETVLLYAVQRQSDTKKNLLQLDFPLKTECIEYEPSEYTFTALAGTSLSEIEEAPG